MCMRRDQVNKPNDDGKRFPTKIDWECESESER